MTHSPQLGVVQSPCCPCVSSRSRSQLKVKYLTNKYYTLCRVRSITPLLIEGFPSNLNDTFTSTRGCAEPMFFPQHISPLLPLYNAQWWGYESLTAIVLVIFNTAHLRKTNIKYFLNVLTQNKCCIDGVRRFALSLVTFGSVYPSVVFSFFNVNADTDSYTILKESDA